jgi:serine/threonine protein kinase
LVEAFFAKKWQNEFACLADVGSRCRLDVTPSWVKSWNPYLYPFWIINPISDRILEYAQIPEINLDEFLDLAALLPPPGYRVLRRLSNTPAFKVVYKAQDIKEKEAWVALKRYKSWDNEQMQQVLSRLGLKEEDVIKKDTLTHWMGSIRHTHIMPCMVVKNKQEELFIVEPLLDTTLDTTTVLDLREVTRFVREVCDAVAFLHSEGLIHSDIKPDNIGIYRGKTVLLDFGIASFYSSDSRTRSNPGSIKTRAPELFSERAVPTFASDVWALGATLMALASGGEYPLLQREELEHLPPAGDPRRAYLEKTILNRIQEYRLNPSDLDDRIRAAIPKALYEAVLSACQMNPDHRTSAKTLIKLLDNVMNAL